MINLYPWRRRLFYRLVCLIVFVVIACCSTSVVLFQYYYRKQKTHQFQLQQKLRRLGSHVPNVKRLELSQLKQINAIIWRRNHYIAQIIKLIQSLPAAVTLNQIACTNERCDLTLYAADMTLLSRAFDKEQEINIKKGVCPQCYRADISVSLNG